MDADSVSFSEATASSGASGALRPDGMPVGRPFSRGRSGNPQGRPPAPIDIAALAREHGPKCIAVLAEMLDDPDRKVRGFAAQALLDRGFGRPTQPVEGPGLQQQLSIWHLVAAREMGERLHAELQHGDAPPVIDGTQPHGQSSGPNGWPDLATPALE